MIGDKASIPPSTICHLPSAICHPPSAYRPVNRLLMDSVPLNCEVERFDPQAPPWDAVSVRIHPTKPAGTLI